MAGGFGGRRRGRTRTVRGKLVSRNVLGGFAVTASVSEIGRQTMTIMCFGNTGLVVAIVRTRRGKYWCQFDWCYSDEYGEDR